MKPRRLTAAQRRALQDAAGSPEGLESLWGFNFFVSMQYGDRYYQKRTVVRLIDAGYMRMESSDGADKATVTPAGHDALAGRVRR